MTTKGRAAKTGGAALIAFGIAGFILGLVTDIATFGGRPGVLMIIGGQAMIIGTMLFCYEQLLIRSVQNEEALRFQYDIGYEAGWRDAERAGRPSLVDLGEYRRAHDQAISRT